MVIVIARPLCLPPVRGLLDGFANPDIGAATADVSSHRGVDVGIIRGRRGREECRSRHDLARLAVSALDHFEVEPGFLYFRAGRRSAHAFDRGDGAIAHGTNRQNTGAYRLAVEMHG